MQMIRQVLTAGFAILSMAFGGCSTPLKYDEGKFFESRIKPLNQGRVEFTLKNVSNQRLAVLQWSIPASDQPLFRDIFEVHQAGKEVLYSGLAMEFEENDSAVKFMEPTETVRAIVPIRDSYNSAGNKPILVKYRTRIQFAVVKASTKTKSVGSLNRVETVTSNAVLLK